MFGFRTKIIFFGYLYFFLITLFCYFFNIHFILSTGLFIIFPTFVLFLLKPRIWKEVFLFSFSLGVPVGLYTQIIAERNFVWKYVPFLSFFQVKDVPLEALFWYPAWFGLVIATYLFFFDKHNHKFLLSHLWLRHLKYFIFCFSVLLFSLFLLNLNAYYLVFPYAYISLISPLVLISIFLFIFQRHKHFLRIFLPTTCVLFLPMLMYDIMGVYANQWTFPGQYFAVLDFGIAKLPIEEFIIWLWLWPASVIAYFEEFEEGS